MGFSNGLLLQVLNPKVIVYDLTLYSTLLAVTTRSMVYLGPSALFLAAVAFAATSTWTLFGTAIKRTLHQPRVRRWVNLVLSLLLVYTAIELSGLIAFAQGLLKRA